MPAVRKNITLTPEQARFVEKEAINLSRLVQQVLEARMAGKKEVRRWERQRRN
jgi:hypothetical protein